MQTKDTGQFKLVDDHHCFTSLFPSPPLSFTYKQLHACVMCTTLPIPHGFKPCIVVTSMQSLWLCLKIFAIAGVKVPTMLFKTLLGIYSNVCVDFQNKTSVDQSVMNVLFWYNCNKCRSLKFLIQIPTLRCRNTVGGQTGISHQRDKAEFEFLNWTKGNLAARRWFPDCSCPRKLVTGVLPSTVRVLHDLSTAATP